RQAEGMGLCRRDLRQCRAAIGAQGHAGGLGRASSPRAYGRGAELGYGLLRAAALGAEGPVRCAGAQIRRERVGRVPINAGNGRMSALGANRTRRDGANDENGTSTVKFAVMQNAAVI